MGCNCRPFSPVQLQPLPPPPTTTTFPPSLRSNLLFTTASDRRNRLYPLSPLFLPNPKNSSFSASPLLLNILDDDDNNNNNDSNNNNNGGGGWSDSSDADEWWRNDGTGVLLFLFSSAFPNEYEPIINSLAKQLLFFFFSALCYFGQFQLASAQARTYTSGENGKEGVEVVWEVRGGRWVQLVADRFNDTFVVSDGNSRSGFPVGGSGYEKNSLPFGVASALWVQCRDLFAHFMLPEGFPQSVTSDYLDYSLWRGVQGIAAQISGVLATQVLVLSTAMQWVDWSFFLL